MRRFRESKFRENIPSHVAECGMPRASSRLSNSPSVQRLPRKCEQMRGGNSAKNDSVRSWRPKQKQFGTIASILSDGLRMALFAGVCSMPATVTKGITSTVHDIYKLRANYTTDRRATSARQSGEHAIRKIWGYSAKLVSTEEDLNAGLPK
jgi:hypothetical protein